MEDFDRFVDVVAEQMIALLLQNVFSRVLILPLTYILQLPHRTV